MKKLEEYNRLARTTDELETLPSVVVVIDEINMMIKGQAWKLVTSI